MTSASALVWCSHTAPTQPLHDQQLPPFGPLGLSVTLCLLWRTHLFFLWNGSCLCVSHWVYT